MSEKVCRGNPARFKKIGVNTPLRLATLVSISIVSFQTTNPPTHSSPQKQTKQPAKNARHTEKRKSSEPQIAPPKRTRENSHTPTNWDDDSSPQNQAHEDTPQTSPYEPPTTSLNKLWDDSPIIGSWDKNPRSNWAETTTTPPNPTRQEARTALTQDKLPPARLTRSQTLAAQKGPPNAVQLIMVAPARPPQPLTIPPQQPIEEQPQGEEPLEPIVAQPQEDNPHEAEPLQPRPEQPRSVLPHPQLDPNKQTINVEEPILQYYRSFAINNFQDAQDVDPLLYILEATEHGEVDPDNCFLSKSGKTIHISYLDPQALEKSENHVGLLLKAQAPYIERREERGNSFYALALNFVSFNQGLLHPEIVVTILKDSKHKDLFQNLTPDNIFIHETKRGRLINVPINSQQDFLKLATENFIQPLTQKNLGALSVSHPMCYTNDPNYVKIYVKNLKTVKSRGALFDALTKGGINPLIVGISRDKTTHYPEGYGFIIIPKQQQEKLEQLQISPDGHSVLHFESAKRRLKQR